MSYLKAISDRYFVLNLRIQISGLFWIGSGVHRSRNIVKDRWTQSRLVKNVFKNSGFKPDVGEFVKSQKNYVIGMLSLSG